MNPEIPYPLSRTDIYMIRAFGVFVALWGIALGIAAVGAALCVWKELVG